MKIHERNPEYLRSEQFKSVRVSGTEGPVRDAPQLTRAVPLSDSLRAADVGRVRAANEESQPELSPERIAEIRQRILAGTYDSLESVELLAKRILASGDLSRDGAPIGMPLPRSFGLADTSRFPKEDPS
jgi:hypothetical protein